MSYEELTRLNVKHYLFETLKSDTQPRKTVQNKLAVFNGEDTCKFFFSRTCLFEWYLCVNRKIHSLYQVNTPLEKMTIEKKIRWLECFGKLTRSDHSNVNVNYTKTDSRVKPGLWSEG